MNCPQCGSRLSVNATVCPSCQFSVKSYAERKWELVNCREKLELELERIQQFHAELTVKNFEFGFNSKRHANIEELKRKKLETERALNEARKKEEEFERRPFGLHVVQTLVANRENQIVANPAASPGSSGRTSIIDVQDILKELDELVGLTSVKAEVSSLINLLKVRKLREAEGLKTIPMSLHMVFSGNPGTGKTTVARLLGKIYRALGIITVGHLVEVDRSNLVAGYLGQTALRVREVFDQAMDGILFIDEAYSLAGQDRLPDSYGAEAINTLLKLIEDHRERVIVIVAGYQDKMEGFLSSNPGLQSRFNKFIHFPDYSVGELQMIFRYFCCDGGYSIDESAVPELCALLDRIHSLKGAQFGNARTIRNLFERVIKHQADRLINSNLTRRCELINIVREDFLSETLLSNLK